MKTVIRYHKAELDAIVEMVYRFNHRLYGYEIGTQPELEPRALSDIKRCVLKLLNDIDADTRSIGTMGFNIQVVERQIVDNMTYIDVEFNFNAWTYGRISNFELVEVEVNK